jgi:hypothetical protein
MPPQLVGTLERVDRYSHPVINDQALFTHDVFQAQTQKTIKRARSRAITMGWASSTSVPRII